MKKFLIAICVLAIGSAVEAQTAKPTYKKPPTLAINFVLNDFQTTEAIRTTSLAKVLNRKQISKVQQMKPGFSVAYLEGLGSNLDFMGTVAGSFVAYPYQNRPAEINDQFLLEVDAALNLKLLPDNYVVVPFVTAGVGVSKYQVYYGAYMPLGTGLQFNIGGDELIMVQAQYRKGVSENTNNHLYFSFGFATTVGKKK